MEGFNEGIMTYSMTENGVHYSYVKSVDGKVEGYITMEVKRFDDYIDLARAIGKLLKQNKLNSDDLVYPPDDHRYSKYYKLIINNVTENKAIEIINMINNEINNVKKADLKKASRQ